MKIAALLLFAASSLSVAQSAVPPQLTQVPPKPTCTLIFKRGACADLWRAYNQALAQRQQEELAIYVNRQKELASAEATAPLQQQISDFRKLNDDQQAQVIKLQQQIQADANDLQQQMQTDATDASNANSEAHTQGLKEGFGIGAGATLVLFALIFVIGRSKNKFTAARKAVA